MPGFEPFDELLARWHTDLERIIERFEIGWQRGERPLLADFANLLKSQCAELLRELVFTDLEYRLKSGEAVRGEEYFEQFPELFVDPQFREEVARQLRATAAPNSAFDNQTTTGHDALTRPLGRHHQSPVSPPSPQWIGELPGDDDGESHRFGDYELLEEIGRGGMGVVYKARHAWTRSLVAIKMILGGPLASPTQLERFRREAVAIRQLRHPNIVAIRDFGRSMGQLFFSMDYIEGRSLAQHISDGPLPPRDAANLLAAVAEAVQFAHEHGILHRDLKPSNILIDVDGHAYVTDFGLARRIDGNSDLTNTGDLLGSPEYMAPEQVRKCHSLTPASDIYSLGATLYAALTGRPPFQSETIRETLNEVIQEPPTSPRQLRPDLGDDLSRICLQCLAKDPAQRIVSAGELAQQLRGCQSAR